MHFAEFLAGLFEFIGMCIGEIGISQVSKEYDQTRDQNQLVINVGLWAIAGFLLGLVVWGTGYSPWRPHPRIHFLTVVGVCSLVVGLIGLVIELIRLRNKPQPAIQEGTFQNSPRRKHKQRRRRREPPA